MGSPAEGGQSSGTQKRSTRACDNCKSRRTKCELVESSAECRNCTDIGVTCRFEAPVRKRGPQPGSRKTANRSVSPHALRPVEKWSNRPSAPGSPRPRPRAPPSDPSLSGSTEGRQQRLPFGGVPGKLVERLLPLYFTHVHNVWPLVYKATFNPHTAPLPLLLSMLAIAACVTPTVDGETTPAGRLFRMAESSVHESRNDCRIDLIQALILLSLRQTGCGDKRSASMFAGRACCMVLNMGLNLAAGKMGKPQDPMETEIRARVYWNAYVLDKSVAEETGRKHLLSYRRTTTPLPSVTELEEFEVWPPPTLSATVPLNVPVVPRRGHVLSCFAWTCRLSMVVEDVLDLEPQTPPAADEWDSQFLGSSADEGKRGTERAAKQLEAWRQALPSHFLVDPNLSPIPHQTVLLAWYHTTCILFYSRFIRSRHPSQSPMMDSSSLHHATARQICSDAAQDTIDILSLLDRYQLLNVASSDMLHILSLATLFEAFNTTSQDPDVASKARNNFSRCCTWLRNFSSSWPAASSHRLFFEGLIQGGLRISSNDLSQPSDPLPNSSESSVESPSMPAGLHAIRRNLSVSEAPSPTSLGISPASNTTSLNPANLFQLPQLYWNHLNTQYDPGLAWDPVVDFGLDGSPQTSLTANTAWEHYPGQLEVPEDWLESLNTQPSDLIAQESPSTADAVQTALMSYMTQAATGQYLNNPE